MIPYLLVIILIFVATLSIITSARGASPRLTTLIAEQQISLWRCQDQLGQTRTRPSVEPWALPRSPAYRRWVLELWTKRRHGCAAQLAEVKRQWNWQAWLPDKWARIGACETGYGHRPGNWRHNSGAYQGAFGFAVSSWDAFKLPGYPDEAYQASPWEQYQVALAIWRRYGFSGWGCRNA